MVNWLLKLSETGHLATKMPAKFNKAYFTLTPSLMLEWLWFWTEAVHQKGSRKKRIFYGQAGRKGGGGGGLKQCF